MFQSDTDFLTENVKTFRQKHGFSEGLGGYLYIVVLEFNLFNSLNLKIFQKSFKSSIKLTPVCEEDDMCIIAHHVRVGGKSGTAHLERLFMIYGNNKKGVGGSLHF